MRSRQTSANKIPATNRRRRELTDLVKDVPLAQTPDTLRLQPWDRDQIHRLFDDLEFRVLRDRLFETLVAVEPEVDEGFDVRGGALEPLTRRCGEIGALKRVVGASK